MKRVTLELLVLVCALSCRAAPPPALESGARAPESTGPSSPPTSSNTRAADDEAQPHDAQGEDETVEDDPEEETDGVVEPSETRPHPLDGWSPAELEKAVKNDLLKLGSISLGSPNAGLLLNAVQASDTPYFKPVAPSGAFGTLETVDYLSAALKRVHAEFPGSPALSLGDISAEHGGRLKPHISHQSGRDLDIGFFYREGARWYRRGTAENLDLDRNWAFVRALITETDVEMILVDHSIQELLRQQARSVGEDPAWLDSLFRGGAGQRAIIRHAPGHATHFHVRFFNPVAQETARRVYPYLVAAGLIPPVQDYLHYKAKKGDTLGKLAKRFGSSVASIKQANALKKNLIREKQVYLIPTRNSRPKPPPPRLSFPARRLPPERGSKPALASPVASASAGSPASAAARAAPKP